MEDNSNFVLSTITDKESGIVVLKNYDEILAQATNFIKDNSLFAEPNINDVREMKACKEERTNLNKALKNIQKARLTICENITGTFVEQCKKIEQLCKQASDEHSKAIHAYEELTKKPDDTAKKIYQVTIYSLDQEALDAVIKYAKKKGCTIA